MKIVLKNKQKQNKEMKWWKCQKAEFNEHVAGVQI